MSLWHPDVTAWLESPHPIGSPEDLELAYLAHVALGCPSLYCWSRCRSR